MIDLSTKGRRLVDVLLAVLAIGGAGMSALVDFPVRAAYAASDLKTVYASAWCFVRGMNAYSVANIEAVFRAQGVETPSSWFGHAAVYPPVSLALIAPLTLLSMPAAVYCVTIFSTLALIFAVWSMLKYATEVFGLGMGWKVALVCLCAGGPLLSFAFEQGNFSVLASALAIVAFTQRNRRYLWVNAGALAVAVLLKPHLAMWFVIAMFFLRVGEGRRVAMRAAGLAAAFSAIVAAGMYWRGSLGFQWRGLISTIHQETLAGASMNPSSREVTQIAAQITSLQSLIGFWSANGAVVSWVASIVLLTVALVLVKETRAIRTEREAAIGVCGWMAFGMLATYHRAYDGIALLLFLPYALDRLRRHARAWQAWAMALFYGVMSFGPGVAMIAERLRMLPMDSAVGFVLLRQAGLADLCLLSFMVMTLRGVRMEGRARVAASWRADEFGAARGGVRPVGTATRGKYTGVPLRPGREGREAGTY